MNLNEIKTQMSPHQYIRGGFLRETRIEKGGDDDVLITSFQAPLFSY